MALPNPDNHQQSQISNNGGQHDAKALFDQLELNGQYISSDAKSNNANGLGPIPLDSLPEPRDRTTKGSKYSDEQRQDIYTRLIPISQNPKPRTLKRHDTESLLTLNTTVAQLCQDEQTFLSGIARALVAQDQVMPIREAASSAHLIATLFTNILDLRNFESIKLELTSFFIGQNLAGEIDQTSPTFGDQDNAISADIKSIRSEEIERAIGTQEKLCGLTIHASDKRIVLLNHQNEITRFVHHRELTDNVLTAFFYEVSLNISGDIANGNALRMIPTLYNTSGFIKMLK